MKDALKNLQAQLDSVGEKLEQGRSAVEVNSVDGIDSIAPSKAGIYWIETTMPRDKMASAISTITGKKRETRKTKPEGIGLIEQSADEFYVAYSGTLKTTSANDFGNTYSTRAALERSSLAVPFRKRRSQISNGELGLSKSKATSFVMPLKHGGA
jgi:hypothetical protein